MRSDDVLKAAAFAGMTNALAPAPVALQPSDWLGNDGNWSTVQFLLGSNADLVSVLVSTSLSEFWAIGPGGCLNKETHCMSARGGIYSPRDSKNWVSWDSWELGLEYLGYGGNGVYGLDTVNSYSPITDIGFGMGNVLTAAINTTDYFLGLYGLGIAQSTFGKNTGESPLTQAVKGFGWIPSYSYGFTAGAYYRNMPVSATLGGYDTERFEAHDTDFTIDQDKGTPRTNVRGIQVDSKNPPADWDSSTDIVSNFTGIFSAMIDSTTPFLWLPSAVCDNIASAFNLTYNETFQLYTLSNDQYQTYSSSDDYSFTFSLSSIDNHDNFGLPLSVPGVVNITVPIKAFVGTLQYPFMRETIKYGQPAIPYFMLRKAISNETEVILGRSFLQESYLVTKYDSGTFSIHQAKFPADPIKNVNLVSIKQPSNSPFPPPPPPAGQKRGLTTAQMVGIGVGVVAFCTILVAALYYWRRRRNQTKRREAALKEEQVHDNGSTIGSETPKTPVARILSRIIRRKRSRRATNAAGSGHISRSEGPDTQIYELPAPLPPVELAVGEHDDDSMGETELGTDSTQNLSAYEIARRKLDRQLAGPVPAYAPPADGVMLPPEKEGHIEVTTQPTYHHYNVSPVRSHEGLGTNSLPGSLPSPVSPRTDGHTNELPSPIDGTLQQYSSRSSKGSKKRRRKDSASVSSSSSHSSPASRSNSNASGKSGDAGTGPSRVGLPLPQATFQRTPIDPSKVVCMGPLPENVKLYRQRMAPHAAATNERLTQGALNAAAHPSEGSLGSNYTDDEDRIVEEMTRQSMKSMNQAYKSQNPRNGPSIRLLPSQEEVTGTTKSKSSTSSRARKSERSGSGSGTASGSTGSQRRPGRIDGDELIHVPQMAEKRYSWEEGQ